MDSYERVVKSLQHEEPDIIPFDLGANANTGIHREAYISLKEVLSFKNKEIEVLDIITQKAKLEEKVKDKMKIDIDGIFPSQPTNWEFKRTEDKKYYYFIDEFGIKWRMPKENNLYYDMYQHPLQDIKNSKDIVQYEFIDPKDDTRFRQFEEKILSADKNKRFYMINSNSPGIFELSLWLRGFENFFMDLAGNKQIAETLLDKILYYKMQYWEKALEYVNNKIIVIGEADDLGTQNNTIISPGMYREFIKPRHKKLFSFIKKQADGKALIFFHSCGSIKELIPDLIEAGVDILNPLQYNAENMDLKELKNEFGSDLVFWGGGIDTQNILPYGTPAEVKEETKRNIHVLAPGGGFIFTTVHNIQADVPSENIIAMWEALQKYGKY